VQLENRLTLDTDAIEDALKFLIEHEYVIENPNSVFYITNKGIEYVNQKPNSDFELR
jgi:predicted transcriptional regulator